MTKPSATSRARSTEPPAAAGLPAGPRISVIWLTVGACLLGLLAATFVERARRSATASAQESQASPVLDVRARGAALYARAGCPSCHGASREGSKLGPPLSPTTLQRMYQSDSQLARFLSTPQGKPFDAAPRWQQLRAGYAQRMAPTRLPLDDLNRLARFLRQR